MAVLMTNALLGTRRRQRDTGRDAHGERLPSGWEPAGVLLPGRVKEAADGTWTLAVDPSLWPLRQGDLVCDAASGEWYVDTADVVRNNLDPAVDYVRVTAHERVDAHTEPGGPEFAGVTGFGETTPGADPVLTGYGPPTMEARIGVEYIDLDNGDVYESQSTGWVLRGNIKGPQGDPGTTDYTALTNKPLLVLGPDEPVPADTPAGTVIVRQTS